MSHRDRIATHDRKIRGATIDLPELDMSSSDRVTQMPEVDLTATTDLPEMDLSTPENDRSAMHALIRKLGLAEPTTNLPEMDMSEGPRKVNMGEIDVNNDELGDSPDKTAFLDNAFNGEFQPRPKHGSRHADMGDVDVRSLSPREQYYADNPGAKESEYPASKPATPASIAAGPDRSNELRKAALGASYAAMDPYRMGLVGGRRSPATAKAQELLSKLDARRTGPAQSKSDASFLDQFDPFKPAMKAGMSGETPQDPMGAVAEGPEAPQSAPPMVTAQMAGPKVTEGPIAAHNSSPASQIASMVEGASPTGDSELEAAQKRSRDAERQAQYEQGMGSAADIISGTNINQHAGEATRKAGLQGVQDVLAKRTESRAAADQVLQQAADRRAQQQQGFTQSQATDELNLKKGGDQRTATTFQDAQEMNKPGTRTAKNYEMLFRAKRGVEAAKLLGDTSQFSANDWKEALATKDDPLAKGAGGGKGAGAGVDKEVIQRVKMIPKHAKAMTDMLNGLDQKIAAAGGPDKIQGIGGPLGAAALLPGIMLDPNSQAFHQARQQISNMSSNALFGSALSPTEAARFDKAISDVSAGHSMAQVMGGMRVVREMVKSGYDQAMAGASPDAKKRIEADMQMNGGGAAPKKNIQTHNGKQYEIVD